jgi:hypothetical protein
MDNASNQFKEDVWQVLAHALANNLIWIALLLLLGGLLMAVFLPTTRVGRDLSISAAVVAIGAFVLHGLAWSPLL